SHNNISGTIPRTFGKLENIESLDLSYNSLSGEIPQTFEKLLQLGTLDLSNNKLTGRIPGGPQMDRLNNPNFYANNSGLCGIQIQMPCEKPSQETKPEESDTKETWFTWKMVAIGYPVGFFSTLLALHATGYFCTTTTCW